MINIKEFINKIEEIKENTDSFIVLKPNENKLAEKFFYYGNNYISVYLEYCDKTQKYLIAIKDKNYYNDKLSRGKKIFAYKDSVEYSISNTEKVLDELYDVLEDFLAFEFPGYKL